jgi:hypothetical protein
LTELDPGSCCFRGTPRIDPMISEIRIVLLIKRPQGAVAWRVQLRPATASALLSCTSTFLALGVGHTPKSYLVLRSTNSLVSDPVSVPFLGTSGRIFLETQCSTTQRSQRKVSNNELDWFCPYEKLWLCFPRHTRVHCTHGADCFLGTVGERDSVTLSS